MADNTTDVKTYIIDYKTSDSSTTTNLPLYAQNTKLFDGHSWSDVVDKATYSTNKADLDNRINANAINIATNTSDLTKAKANITTLQEDTSKTHTSLQAITSAVVGSHYDNDTGILTLTFVPFNQLYNDGTK